MMHIIDLFWYKFDRSTLLGIRYISIYLTENNVCIFSKMAMNEMLRTEFFKFSVRGSSKSKKKNNINMYVIKVAEKDLYIYSTRHTTHVCIYSNDWLYWLLSIEPASNFPKETWFCCPIFLYNTSLDTCNQHGFSLLTYLHVCIYWAKSSALYQAQLIFLGSLKVADTK